MNAWKSLLNVVLAAGVIVALIVLRSPDPRALWLTALDKVGLAEKPAAPVLPALPQLGRNLEPFSEILNPKFLLPKTGSPGKFNLSPAPAPAPVSAPAKLDERLLGERLAEAGFTCTTSKSTENVTIHEFKVDTDGWTVPFRASLSPDGSLLWLSALLIDEGALAAASPAVLRNLLERNLAVGPAHFVWLPNSKLLALSNPVPNGPFAAAALKARVLETCRLALAERNAWQPDSWLKS